MEEKFTDALATTLKQNEIKMNSIKEKLSNSLILVEKNETNKVSTKKNIPKKFNCESCKYHTDNSKDFKKHQTTLKHITLISKLEVDEPKSEKKVEYECKECKKLFNNRVTLWRHKGKCAVITKDDVVDEKKEFKITSELVQVLIKENKELKDVLIEQSKAFIEQNNKLIELSTKQNTTLIQNNTTNNTTTTNNNSFNLNLFLNEQCKDAISITDFVESLNLDSSDIKATGQLGYVLGISRIFINKLKEMDVYERPLHCTDYKRETVYIKNEDTWEKDNQEKSKLRNIVSRIARKNLEQLPAWQNENPDYVTLDTPENNEFMKISLSSLGGYSNDEENKHVDKIMRNVLKEVVVSKSCLLDT
jgi:hypothetical protein